MKLKRDDAKNFDVKNFTAGLSAEEMARHTLRTAHNTLSDHHSPPILSFIDGQNPFLMIPLTLLYYVLFVWLFDRILRRSMSSHRLDQNPRFSHQRLEEIRQRQKQKEGMTPPPPPAPIDPRE
jgi:hypothetical protein